MSLDDWFVWAVLAWIAGLGLLSALTWQICRDKDD